MDKSEIQENLKEILDEEKVKEAIKNNKFEFMVDDVKYRVVGLTYDQRRQVYEKKSEKYMELLDNDKYLLEADLIKKYKKRGIDIDDLTKQIRLLVAEKDNLDLKLGSALANKESDTNLDVLKTEIEKINDKIREISAKKAQLLDYSIENQSSLYAFGYLMFLITEKLVDGKWVKVWNTYKEFENEKESLLNKITFYASIIGAIGLES